MLEILGTRSDRRRSPRNRIRPTVEPMEERIVLSRGMRLSVPDGGVMARAALSRPPVLIARQIAATGLAEADGTPDNKSAVVVPFTGRVTVADSNRIRLTATLADPSSGRRTTVSIPVLSATADASGKALVLTTGRQVPKGATLKFDKGAMLDGSGRAMKATTATIQSSTLSAGDFVMVNRGFRPTNVNLFSFSAFPAATVAPSVAGAELSEADAAGRLRALLDKKVRAGTITKPQATEAMALFGAESTKAIIPSPSLRAGLLTLTGTAASQAIPAVLTGANASGKPYASIAYDPALDVTDGLAVADAGGSRTVRIAGRVMGQSPVALGSLLAHEIMHQDDGSSQNEEILADAARALSWAQNILIDPVAASVNSGLVRSNNTALLAILNSGNRAYPKVGLTSAPQLQRDLAPVAPHVFVGGYEGYRSFEDYVRKAAAFIGLQDIDTAGNPYLDGLLSSATGSVTTGNDLDRASLQLLDRSQRLLRTAEVLRLAKILKLTV